MNAASFFSGIGGIDKALESAGMKIVFQCEINKFCQSILRKHWPDVPLWTDIKTLTADVIPEADLWCGGFPCQDLSLANQGKREGLNGNRSGLFFQYADLISKRKPRWVIIENVPGLLNSAKGEDFKTVIQKLDELGYGISWRVLDAKYFGTPQRRRRVYIVASLGSMRSAQVLFEQGTTTIVDRSGLGKEEVTSQRTKEGLSGTDIYAIQHASIGRKHTAGPQAKGYRNDGETYTLDSRGGADAICSTVDPFRMREITRVPSGLDGKRYRAVGNSVAVPVIHWIGMRIMALEKSYE
jgi:DNA (cytosine-5)-methyltransferase 1